ncbi:MAG: PAS domain S-box protein [Candidatus Sulfobium sp.]|jgi:PAS domain S-box-containing protein
MFKDGDLFYSLIQNSSDSITILEEDGTVSFVTPSVERMTGYAPDELIGRNAFLLVHPDDLSMVEEAFAKVMRNPHVPLTAQYRFRHKNGSWSVIESTGSNQLDNPHVSGIVINSRDVTEREKILEALRESEEKYRLLFEKESDAITLYDAETLMVLETNDSFVRLYGYNRAETAGLKATDLSEEPEKTIASAGRTVARGSDYVPVRWHRKKDGTIFPVEISAGTFTLKGRKVICAIFRDITERMRAERELAEYREHLEELVARRTKEIEVLNDRLRQSQKMEAVGLLAGGIAHDFNNILATIKGSLYMIQKRLAEESPVMKYAGQILTSVEKANDLTQSLLAFSRKQAVALKRIDLNEVIRKTAGLLSRVAGEKTDLKTKFSPDTPEVMGDESQLVQVLVNLATNARDAMPAGGILTICTDTTEIDEEFIRVHGYGTAGRYALLTVSDTGTGIDGNVKEKIFEPFFTTKIVGKGSGLGLAITYGIVKQHRGYVDVESPSGGGTVFRIYLPVLKSDTAGE